MTPRAFTLRTATNRGSVFMRTACDPIEDGDAAAVLTMVHTPDKFVALQAVELLPQAIDRHQATGAANLRLAENERENRDIQIDTSDSQHPPRIGAHPALHGVQDFR